MQNFQTKLMLKSIYLFKIIRLNNFRHRRKNCEYFLRSLRARIYLIGNDYE